MIIMFGDPWLKKVHQLFQEFYPEIVASFVPEGGEIPDQTDGVLLASHGADLPPGLVPDLLIPRIRVFGLASIETAGQSVIGGSFLPDTDHGQRNKLIAGLAAGKGTFGCEQRLGRSLQDLSGQCEVGAQLSQYIADRYRHTSLFSGADRPNPTLTVYGAQRIAAHLGLDDRIMRDEPWRTDNVAYRPSLHVLLPFDADELGIEHDLDSQWFATLSTIINRIYTDDGTRKPSLEPDSVTAKASRAMWSDLLSPPSARLVPLLLAQKRDDLPDILAEINNCLASWGDLSASEQATVGRMILKWWPLNGRGQDAIIEVLSMSDELEPQVARKITNVAIASLNLDQMTALRDQLAARRDFGIDLISKLEKRAALMLRQQQRMQG